MARVEPRYRWAPEIASPGWAPEVIDLCDMLGYHPDDNQAPIIEQVFAENQFCRPAMFEVAVIAPRQNIKTGVAKQCSLGWLFLTRPKRIVYTAHEYNPACGATFTELMDLIDGNDWTRRRIRKVQNGKGDESIETTTGTLMMFKPRTAGGLRSLAAEKVILDEGLFLKPEHAGTIYPLMATLPDAQALILSSGGLRRSGWLRGIRDRGRAGDDPRLGYNEWAMPPAAEACELGDECDHGKGTRGCALDNPQMLAQSNPAYEVRISLERLKDFRRTMPVDEFGREFGTWWDDPPDDGGEDSPIDASLWGDLEVEPDELDDVDVDQDEQLAALPVPVAAWALELDPDRAWATIVFAGPYSDTQTLVEIVDRQRGTAWIVDRFVELDSRHGPAVIVIDGGGPAKTLIEPLTDAGLQVLVANNSDLIEACGTLVDAVNQATVVHLPSEPLDDAIAAARKRASGAFKRVTGSEPAIGIALARWAGDGTYNVLDSAY